MKCGDCNTTFCVVCIKILYVEPLMISIVCCLSALYPVVLSSLPETLLLCALCGFSCLHCILHNTFPRLIKSVIPVYLVIFL